MNRDREEEQEEEEVSELDGSDDQKRFQMNRGLDDEGEISELLQRLDVEAADPSNEGDNPGDLEPELEPKHKIFLSHSGVQKNFTEQLCVDLERCEYSPFFDKRPDSLPKGRRFPELIFQAARQCRVAILVLSEDFFTRTKWPMLELEAFAQSENINSGKLSILPVYLGLSRNKCTGDETRRRHWLSVWRDWAKKDDRIDVGKWEAALKVLGPFNGVEYVESLGEVELRKQIVRAVRRLISPEISWSAAHVQGRARIVEAIIKKRKNIGRSEFYGVCVLGVHGIGGFGKTTLCRVLCDEFHTEFEGKVCHAELGSKSPIELHKDLLRRLTDINHDSLMLESDERTMNQLKRHIHRQPVFLALDNVSQESLEQAKDLLEAPLHRFSVVLVMARSTDILHRLQINESDCMEMPDLQEEEAKQLFLRSAGFRSPFVEKEDDEYKIQYCIRQCWFRKGANMEKHFHPLALKVLGAALRSRGCDPSTWLENLSKVDKLNPSREEPHPVFKLLRVGYDSLNKEDQLFFMDAVLFHPSLRGFFLRDMNFQHARVIKHPFFRLNIFEWLGIVHNQDVKIVEDRLQNLKARALIEDIGDGFKGVLVHDLYLEFAKSEVKRGVLDVRRWVWYDKEVVYPVDLEKSPFGKCWSNVERFSVKYFVDPFYPTKQWIPTRERMKWKYFANVVVLQLVVGNDAVLDLRDLRCLKSMDLNWSYGSNNSHKSEGQLIGLGELRNLAWLAMTNIHFAPCFQEIGLLTSLQALRLDMKLGCDRDGHVKNPCQEPVESLDLGECIQLQELVLECPCLKSFPDLSNLTLLRSVLFNKCETAKEVVGLSSQMTSLQEFFLVACKSLSQCLGLSNLVSLQELRIEDCSWLMHTLDLYKLTKLQRLSILGNGINELLGLDRLLHLREFQVSGVGKFPNLNLLRHIQRLSLRAIEPLMMPGFDDFTALEELFLIDLPDVADIPGMGSLTRLKRMRIEDAPHLSQLPELGDLMALQYLKLHECCRSRGELELPDLHSLINLEVLVITNTPIRRLPSLQHLTQLKELCCRSTLLVELPDLSCLDKLERIDLAHCNAMTSLEKVGTLPALTDLCVSHCSSLTRLPDLRSSTNLEVLDISCTHIILDPEDIRALATLRVRVIGTRCNSEYFSKLLQKMSMAEVILYVQGRSVGRGRGRGRSGAQNINSGAYKRWRLRPIRISTACRLVAAGDSHGDSLPALSTTASVGSTNHFAMQSGIRKSGAS